jgi:uncharacterized membrane protein
MIPVIILAAVLFLALGGVTALWLIFIRRQTTIHKELPRETSTRDILPLRWPYIILPLAILALAIVMSAYFYQLLPTEVAYHFESDGTPDRWFSQGMAMAWVLVPQLLLTLFAAAIVWGIAKSNILPRQVNTSGMKPERVLSFMGNLIALPQLVVGFAMLDIFSYNVFQTHIIPLRPLLFIILGLATAGLGLFLMLIIIRAMRQITLKR